MSVWILLPLPQNVLARYVRAARRLRKSMAGEAPTTEQLMVHALSDRPPDAIVGDHRDRRNRREKR